MPKQEKELVRVIANEQENFLRFVRRKITSISEMDAEDIVADVIFNVYNKVEVQQHFENVISYIYQSIRNRIIDYLRKPSQTISLDSIDASTGLSLKELIPDASADFADKVDQDELRTKLYLALMDLEPKQRAVWVATEIEGYSFKELAVKWNVPIGTLLSRKSRAQKILKEKLKDMK